MLPALVLHSIILALHTCTGGPLNWLSCHPELVEGLLEVTYKDEQGFDKLSLTPVVIARRNDEAICFTNSKRSITARADCFVPCNDEGLYLD